VADGRGARNLDQRLIAARQARQSLPLLMLLRSGDLDPAVFSGVCSSWVATVLMPARPTTISSITTAKGVPRPRPVNRHVRLFKPPEVIAGRDGRAALPPSCRAIGRRGGSDLPPCQLIGDLLDSHVAKLDQDRPQRLCISIGFALVLLRLLGIAELDDARLMSGPSSATMTELFSGVAPSMRSRPRENPCNLSNARSSGFQS
jgi:hypothetical protein